MHISEVTAVQMRARVARRRDDEKRPPYKDLARRSTVISKTHHVGRRQLRPAEMGGSTVKHASSTFVRPQGWAGGAAAAPKFVLVVRPDTRHREPNAKWRGAPYLRRDGHGALGERPQCSCRNYASSTFVLFGVPNGSLFRYDKPHRARRQVACLRSGRALPPLVAVGGVVRFGFFTCSCAIRQTYLVRVVRLSK